MTSSFLNNIGYEKPKSEQERFLEAIAPGGDYTMPPDKPKRSRGVQPSAGWKKSVGAYNEAQRLGRPMTDPTGASAYYGPGGDPTGSGRGQAQRRSGTVGLMGPDGKPFDPTRKPERPAYTGEGLTGRDSKRGRATGTQMSPRAADFDDFQKVLEGRGVSFNFGQDRQGMQSNSLPTVRGNAPDTSNGNVVRITNGQNQGNYIKVNDPNFDKIIRGEMAGGFVGEQGGGLNGADSADQSRAVPMQSDRLSEALSDTNSLRFNPSNYEKDPDRPDDIYETAGLGLDRRSRAFLDGPDDSMLALRNADAAQGFIKQQGKYYTKGSNGNWVQLSDEGVEGLKQDRNQIASQEYADKFKLKTAADSQSADSSNPLPVTRKSMMDLAESEVPGTIYVPSDSNEGETFNSNASRITGNPAQFYLPDSNVDYFTQKPTGEPNKSWLPTEDEFEREELARLIYK